MQPELLFFHVGTIDYGLFSVDFEFMRRPYNSYN